MGTIYTHKFLDLDAAASVWAAKRFIPEMRQAQVAFMPANWDGQEMIDGDIAVDISAGGKGWKGQVDASGNVHSCFAYILYRFASADEKLACEALVKFIDAQDAHGSAVKHFAPEISLEAFHVFSRTGINSVLRAYQKTFERNDLAVFEQMSIIFDGLFAMGMDGIALASEVQKAVLVGNGKVAIVDNPTVQGVNGALFERGVDVVVYVDGDNMGLVRKDTCPLRMDHLDIQAVILQAGEQLGDEDGKWYAHPKGFLLSWGSKKSPATKPSSVDPAVLAQAVATLLGG